MNNGTQANEPSISGVPDEIQESIKSDIIEKNADNKTLYLRRVGISVSENEDLGELGYSTIHLRDLTIELARNLLINDCKIVYGGDLRKEGYTELFSDLAYQYRSIKENKFYHFENYFAYPIYKRLTRQHRLDFKKHRAEIHEISPPTGTKEESEYFHPNSIEAKLIWSISLSEMRNRMIENSDARILVGGKLENYVGKKPGVIEEAQITLVKDKPLYLSGAFGGGSKQVIEALKGSAFSYGDNAFHKTTDYSSFRTHFNKTYTEDPIDESLDLDFFSKYGVQKLSKNNGLTIEENERLFVSPHLSEIVFLILKGLQNLNKK
jgi:hypothetical protein